MRFRDGHTHIHQQSVAVVPFLHVIWVDAQAAHALQISQHLVEELVGDGAGGREHFLDYGSEGLSAFGWFPVLLLGTVPRCDAESLFELFLRVSGECHVAVAMDCDFAVEVRVDESPEGTAFGIEGVVVVVEYRSRSDVRELIRL